MVTSLGEGKLWIQSFQTQLENWPCVISCLCRGVGKNIYIYACLCVCVYIYIIFILSGRHDNQDRCLVLVKRINISEEYIRLAPGL